MTWWSYGDSNPRALACHTVATRPQKYICAGHCLGTSASVPRNPGLLLYFRAYSPELPPAQAERTGSREAHAGHSTGLYLPATRDRRRERPNSPATSARYRPLEKRTAGRRKPADPAHVTTLRTSKRPPVAEIAVANDLTLLRRARDTGPWRSARQVAGSRLILRM